MVEAVIVVGGERRFLDEVRPFVVYFRQIGLKRIRIVRSAYLWPQDLQRILARLFTSVGDNSARPFLLMYCGHGGQEGWNLHGSVVFPYEELAELLTLVPGNILFLNACCCAFAVARRLKEKGFKEERTSLIAESDGDPPSTGAWLPHLLGVWNRQGIFTPGELRPVVQLGFYFSSTLSEKEQYWDRLRQRASERLHQKFPEDFPAIYCGHVDGRLCEEEVYMGMEPDKTTERCRRWGAYFDSAFFPPYSIE